VPVYPGWLGEGRRSIHDAYCITGEDDDIIAKFLLRNSTCELLNSGNSSSEGEDPKGMEDRLL
jgi:hypothetical protein